MTLFRLSVDGGDRVNVGVPQVPDIVRRPPLLHGRSHGQIRRDRALDRSTTALSLQSLVQDVHVVGLAIGTSAGRHKHACTLHTRSHLDVPLGVDRRVV